MEGKKILVFDLSSAQAPRRGSKYGGMILYTTAVFYKLVENLRDDIELKAIYIPNNYIVPELLDFCKNRKIQLIDATEDSIISVVKRIDPDLFFTPNPTKNRIIVSGVRMMTVCHDIRTTEIYFDKLYWRFITNWKELLFLVDSVLFSGFFQRRNMLKIANRFLGHENIEVIAVSQHTKHHIMVHFPDYFYKEMRVFFSPMLENVSRNNDEMDSCLEEMGICKRQYFFMDSGWRWSKNDLRAAIALDRIFNSQNNLDMKVVITGVKSPKPYYKYIRNTDKFIFLNYVERDMLNSLHKYAYATIYPTLGEGFGYTPMESFKYGVPVIAAANSSVFEVCGDAVLYTNPYSIQEIQNRCYQILNSDIYDEYARRCLDRYNIISKIQRRHLSELVDYIQSKCIVE